MSFQPADQVGLPQYTDSQLREIAKTLNAGLNAGKPVTQNQAVQQIKK